MTTTSRPGHVPRSRDVTGSVVGPLAMGAIGAAAIGTLAVVDPNTSGLYPTCPSLALFGVLCPLCGGLRGVHALTQGDLVAMVSSNLLLPLVLVLGTWAWLSWVSAALGGPTLRPPSLGRRAWIGVVALAAAYAVLRNLTGTPFEVLAP